MKKIAIVCLVGLFLSGILLDQSVLADVTADLSQAEGLYKSGRRDQAEQRYLKVIREADPNKSSDSDAVFTAAKGLSLVYIATDRLPQAKEAIRPLLKRPTPHALHEIVEEAKALKKLPQVHEVYQEMIAAQPNDPNVIWLKTGLGVANVYLADDKAVEATLQDIIANHGSDNRAAEAFGQVAWAYRKLQQYDKGLKINQYTVDNWPQKDRAAYAQQGIVASQVALKDFAAADKAIDTLIQKFGKDPDASKLVLWSGFSYDDISQNDKACKVYELVVQNYPRTPEAVTAQLRIASASVKAEDPNRMRQTIGTLVTQFAVTPDKAESLRIIAVDLVWKQFGYANRTARQPETPAVIDESLLATANYTLANWPKSDWALWAQRSLATVALHRGDDKAAQAAIDRLTGDYADRKDTPAALNFLADYSLELKKYNQAERIYKYVWDHWPKDKQGVLAGAGQAKVRIATGDDTAAEAILRKLSVNDPNHPDLPNAVLVVGQGYFEKGQDLAKVASTQGVAAGRAQKVEKVAPREFPEAAQVQMRKAIAMWAPLLTAQSTASPQIAAEAQYYTIWAYFQLSDYQAVVDQAEQLIARSPDYSNTWQVVPLIVQACRQQVAAGTMTEKDCRTATDQAYKWLLEKYPDCQAAKQIREASAVRQAQAAKREQSRGGKK